MGRLSARLRPSLTFLLFLWPAIESGQPIWGVMLSLVLISISYDYSESSVHVGQALSIGQSLTEGDSALSKGHFTAAINAYSKALDQDSQSTLILGKRGNAYLAQGSLRQALKDYDAAIDIDPKAYATLLKRAKLFRRICKFREAENDLEIILTYKSEHKAARKERSLVLDLQESWEQLNNEVVFSKNRRRLLSKILDSSPSCQQAKFQQAEFLLQDKDYGGVILMTGQLLKQDSTDASALLLRGQAYYFLGDLDIAKKHFSEALRSDPDHKSAKTWFKSLRTLLSAVKEAESLQQSGDSERAEERYLHAISLNHLPDVLLHAFWFEVCKLRIKLGSSQPAVDACTLSAGQDPDSEERVIEKVKALILNKQYGEAFQEASTAHRKWESSRAVYEVFREAELAQKMAERKQYYEILNISKQASHTEIKRAYRDLARRFHPDKAASEGISVEIAQEKFTDISEAYEILSDPEQRQAYDEGRDLQVGQGQAGGGYSQFHSQGFGGFPQSGGQQFFFRYG